MVKNYKELSYKEKKLVVDFLNRKNKEKLTFKAVEKEILSKVYDLGEGTLFYFKNNEVLGKAYVVLEVVERLHTVYIHSVDLLEDNLIKSQVLEALIEKSKSVANKYGAKKILLGIRDEKVLEAAELLGLRGFYSAFIMNLEDKETKCQPLELTPLSKENKYEYMDVYNNSFMDMPHGTYLDIKEVEEYIIKQENNRHYFVSSNNTSIGFLSTEINGKEGKFDIGLLKKYRGMGYGKRLLETAIINLKNLNVEEINLIVIEKNTIALNMYKKRGFVIQSNLSYWIEL